MAKKKNPNSLGIHRRRHLLKICDYLQMKGAPGWSNRDIVYALAEAKKIGIGVQHVANAEIILAWFREHEPEAFAPRQRASKTKKPNQAFSLKSEFYRSWEWRTVRMEVLKTHGFACQCCGAKSGDIAMSGDPVRICVDHIKPLSKFWELRLDKGNLQVLCDECNQGKGAWDQTDHR